MCCRATCDVRRGLLVQVARLLNTGLPALVGTAPITGTMVSRMLVRCSHVPRLPVGDMDRLLAIDRAAIVGGFVRIITVCTGRGFHRVSWVFAVDLCACVG